MKELFESRDYKDFLRKIIYSPDAKRGFQAQLAKAMGCQAAYLSQVVKSKPDLSETQAFKLCQHLRFSPLATEYFMLLVRIARASSPELRDYLEQQRERLIQDSQEIHTRVPSGKTGIAPEDLQRYFSSWIPSTLHIATSGEDFQTAEALSERLRLPKEVVATNLEFLAGLKLVEKKGKQWKFSSGAIHFPRESPINIPHQTSRRHQSLRALEEGDPQNVHFSSVFTLDAETFRELKADLLDYIERSHKKIHKGGTNDMYSLCLDLFRVV